MVISERAIAVFSATPYLLQGVGVTLRLTLLALILGAFFGLLLALARVYGGSVSRRFAILYSRVIRSLPLLVILFMLYFVTAQSITMSVFVATALALAIHTSAYQSEIFRGAIQSVSAGQMEAALAIGMSRFQSIAFIILPQALRRSIPYWGNEAAIVLKDSALAYALGIAELMRRGEYVAARTAQPLLTYLLVGAIYFILTALLTRSLAYVEGRVRIPG